MIVLDTNVLSELMRPKPDPKIVDWVDAQAASALFVTAITVAEILYGIERMAEGRRQQRLATLAATLFNDDFAGRILSFDAHAAAIYARQTTASVSAGRTVQFPDAQIAAICVQHDATLATRNVKDFQDMDVVLIDPWQNAFI